MGLAHSSWKLDRKLAKRASRFDSDLHQKKKSAVRRSQSSPPLYRHKSESNLSDEMKGRAVNINPLYGHKEMFDNGLFFEEILAKIEQQAGKLSTSQRYGESPKGFDSFMMY